MELLMSNWKNNEKDLFKGTIYWEKIKDYVLHSVLYVLESRIKTDEWISPVRRLKLVVFSRFFLFFWDWTVTSPIKIWRVWFRNLLLNYFWLFSVRPVNELEFISGQLQELIELLYFDAQKSRDQLFIEGSERTNLAAGLVQFKMN